MDFNVKKDQDELGRLHDAATKLVEDASSAGRNMDTDENARFDDLIAQHGELEKAVARKMKLAGIKSDEVEKIEELAERSGKSADETHNQKEQSRKALASYLRNGYDRMSPQEREIMSRAQSSGTDTEGGFTVDEVIASEIIQSMAKFGGMRDAATVITTSTGGVLNYVTNDDTANVGAWLAENTAAAAQDTVYGNVALNAWKASTDYMLVSRELVQDASIDIIAHVSAICAERAGRLTNTAYTVGDGSSKPNGVITAASEGAVTDVTLVVDFDDLLDLKHSVDPAYQMNAKWMFNDLTLRNLKKVAIASANQSLWQPGIAGGAPATIDGQEYIVNTDMADIAAQSHSVAYGDFSKYIIRDVTGFELLRSDQLNMLANQITFVGFLRTDGDLVDTGAVKYLRTLGT